MRDISDGVWSSFHPGRVHCHATPRHVVSSSVGIETRNSFLSTHVS